MTAPEGTIQIPAGLICVTTFGWLRGETSQCLGDLRSNSERNGLTNVGWATIPGGLVDKARNDAVRQMLGAFDGKAQWILFVDGDMTFQPDALMRLLQVAYGSHPWTDAVGAYCTLRGDMGLPTIDTGTGTWEVVYPGKGVVEVIRTGAAFILVKRHVYERLPQPWYATRVPAKPIDFMVEVDNWARIKLDGQNPFRNLPGKPWEKLMELAVSDPSARPGTFVPAEVGEDSGFCDKMRAAGLRIAVNTDVEIGHLETKVSTAQNLREKMDDLEAQWLQAVGVA